MSRVRVGCVSGIAVWAAFVPAQAQVPGEGLLCPGSTVHWFDTSGGFGTAYAIGRNFVTWHDSSGTTGTVQAISPRFISWWNSRGDSGSLHFIGDRMATWHDSQGNSGTIQRIGDRMVVWSDNRGNSGMLQAVGDRFVTWSDNRGNWRTIWQTAWSGGSDLGNRVWQVASPLAPLWVIPPASRNAGKESLQSGTGLRPSEQGSNKRPAAASDNSSGIGRPHSKRPKDEGSKATEADRKPKSKKDKRVAEPGKGKKHSRKP